MWRLLDLERNLSNTISRKQRSLQAHWKWEKHKHLYGSMGTQLPKFQAANIWRTEDGIHLCFGSVLPEWRMEPN
ncbi:hypothetical protein PanWU01x14_306730 [Parasponia andersonii]|uniref:Uncharacterized protein n=1 Tax=Parasponia andersonii TaxID=3476 RepID=A0A2P5ARJ0_PARAD|nr:hypothetical protein PanWU01x14_306730 [Parasponia andersonii]